MKHIYFILLATILLFASCSQETTQLTFRHFVYENTAPDTIVNEFGGVTPDMLRDGEPVCYVAYDLEFPVKAADEEVLERLQLNILSILGGGIDLTVAKSREEMKQFFAGMKLTESDTCPVDPIEMPAGLNITSHELSVVRTITNDNSLYTLCLSNDFYAFGAAHGFYSLSYHSFNTATGNVLTFDSLFEAGADTVFCSYMTRQIPIDYQESYGEEFTFQNDPLVGNGTFYFTPDGVIFSFSPYAIGSYADGQIDCLIPTAVSKPLLRKEWGHLLK